MDSAEVLSCCAPEFARAWEHAGDAYALAGHFLNGAAVLLLRGDGTAQAVLWDERFERLFASGLGREEVRANFFMLLTRFDRPRFVEACRQAAEGSESVSVDAAWRVDEGGSGRATQESYLVTYACLQKVGATGQGPLLYLAVNNFSHRAHAQRDLQRVQYINSLEALFDEAFTLDLDTGVVELLFCREDSVPGEAGSCGCEHRRQKTGFYAYSRRVHKDDKQLYWGNTNTKQIIRRLFSEDPDKLISFDLRVRDEGDAETYRWTSFAITRVANGEGKRIALVCVRNIDQQKDAMRRERELRSRAQHDSLTGIFNRGTTEELVTAALAGREPGQQCALLVVDVDKFKNVNDTYGHLMGDKLLVAVAQAILGMCGEGDIAGRIGGDEFVVFLRGSLGSAYEELAQRIGACQHAVAEFSFQNGIEPPVTLSAGVVPVDDCDISYHDLFARADKMLYSAKREGRNGYRLYTP
ncbi:MAG: GGDEF domain-containing protein [Coriobacteriales bacterium]